MDDNPYKSPEYPEPPRPSASRDPKPRRPLINNEPPEIRRWHLYVVFAALAVGTLIVFHLFDL